MLLSQAKVNRKKDIFWDMVFQVVSDILEDETVIFAGDLNRRVRSSKGYSQQPGWDGSAITRADPLHHQNPEVEVG